jgi:hypothetical protein
VLSKNRQVIVSDSQKVEAIVHRWQRDATTALFSCILVAAPAFADAAPANTEEFPKQILRTGVNLAASEISPNSRQLADQLHLTPLLVQLEQTRDQALQRATTLEGMAVQNQHVATMAQANSVIQQCNLAIDFTQAEITAEENIYNEVLSTFTGDRDKAVLKTNALSFILNGALWTIAEAYDIPTARHPNFAVTSGTTGILAGIVPSIASMYALKQLNGKKRTSEVEPNMLAKLFDYPTNVDIEYPPAVWAYLNSAPPGEKLSRKDQLINRWVADKNIPGFTSNADKKTLDVITASVAQKKGLTISTLTIRLVMLQQLSAEIVKMKRILLDLSMAVSGDKRIGQT